MVGFGRTRVKPTTFLTESQSAKFLTVGEINEYASTTQTKLCLVYKNAA